MNLDADDPVMNLGIDDLGSQTPTDTTSGEFFDAIYRRDDDPWQFADSVYEQQRYAHLVAMLDGRRFARAFEPGCSIGELTALLAPWCAQLLAVDISEVAVARARQRCIGFPHVDVRLGALPDDLPAGPFDLVVFSEIGYYFSEAALGSVLEAIVEQMSPGGAVVGTHWTGSSADHIISGAQVHEAINSVGLLQPIEHASRPSYVAGRWQRR